MSGSADALIGQEVDGYRILDVLGRGGMGIVYKAQDQSLSKTVALKMIDPMLAHDASFLRRFRSEARALARLDSPYIVRVHAMRDTEIGMFIVMEYINGSGIDALLKRGSMPWEKALPLIRQMLVALEHAHGVGITHRDLKPSNVMVTEAGQVKVTDFGLAKVQEGGPEETQTKGVVGTLFYMAPEQVKGTHRVDQRTDLYALGVTVYRMLTGRLPFDRDLGQFAIMRAIVEQDPPPPSTIKPDIPQALNAIIMRAMEKRPAERYQRAAEMRADLEAFEATLPKSVTPGGPVRQKTGSSRRTTVLATAALLVAALLVLAGVLIYQILGAGTSQTLSLTTTPGDALVWIDGAFVGQSPLLEREVEGDRVQVRVQKEGYATLDTVVTAGTTVNLVLVSADVSTELAIRTDPPEVEVFIDNQRVGQTPVDANVSGRFVALRLEKEGYVPIDTLIALESGPRMTFRQQLERELIVTRPPPDPVPPTVQPRPQEPEPEPETESEPVTGTLNLQFAEGSVTVNGENRQGGGSFTLPVGTHTVVFQHPRYGESREQVTVEPGPNDMGSYHFEATINVSVTPVWGSVWIDGEHQGESPGPGSSVMRGPGTYRVEVRRDGYQTLTEPQTITVEPGFGEPVTHRRVFQLQKEN